MAYFFGDGFDLYKTDGSEMLGHWDNTSLNPALSNFAAGRFSGSRAIAVSNSSRFHKVSGSNDSVHHFVFSAMQGTISGASLGTFFELDDGVTAQCTVVFRSDGAILLTLGGPAGTVLATWTGAIALINVWYAFEIEVVVHNTSGSISIRRNGSPTDDFFLGSLDTASTANNYANRLVFGTQSSGSVWFDDLLWRSDAASVPWVGDIRCYTRYPVADVSVQFSKTTTPYSAVLNGAVGVANSFGADRVLYIKFTPSFSGLVTGASLTCNVSGGGGTGHVKVALFAANAAGGIGVVLATSSEVTNPGAAVISFVFPTPVRIEIGSTYFIAINQDAPITYNVSTIAGAGVILITGQTYATWPVSNPGGAFGASQNTPGNFTVIVTPETNADTVGELQQSATANYVYSSTNGHADFYAIGSIGVVPAGTLGVVTRGYFTKSDAGTRNATVQVKSGGTTVQGISTTFVPTVWTWVGRLDLTDPATGAAWTAPAVNNVQIGPKVTA